MRKLLIYLKDYKKETILGPLFKLLEASFELMVPLVIAAMIDKGIANGDKGYVGRMCLILILLCFVGFRVEFYSNRVFLPEGLPIVCYNRASFLRWIAFLYGFRN